MNDDDRLNDRLRSLPAHDAREEVVLRTRRQALSTLAREQANLERPWMGTMATLWSRFVMPVALASVVGVYLIWAFQFAGALYR